MLRRKLAVLMAAAGMVVVVLAFTGVAWADDDDGGAGKPRVVRTVPPDEATGVPLDALIKVTFSERMKASSINELTIRLYYGHSTSDPGCTVGCTAAATVTYNDRTKTAKLDAGTLLPNQGYTVVVEGTGDGDKVAVKDRGGTPMARDYIFQFTTGSGAPCETC